MNNAIKNPTVYRYLEISRERRGWIFNLCCPDGEKENHGDHHADGGIPNDHLPAVVNLRIREDQQYMQCRKVVYGLFNSPYGESAYSSLMQDHTSKEKEYVS